MKACEIIHYLKVNPTEADKVSAIADDIKANGWRGAPILVSESFGMLITGSHRLAAIEKLIDDDADFDLDSLGDIAENVDDEINDWCERTGSCIEDIDYSSLGQIFDGTWVEQYKSDITEW